MSQENVEIVRRIIEAFETGAERGDFETAWETGAVAPDVEWVAFAELEQRSFTGREGFVEFMRRWTEDLLGRPTVRAQIETTGNYGGIAARLWDLTPDGQQRLVDRGVYSLDGRYVSP